MKRAFDLNDLLPPEALHLVGVCHLNQADLEAAEDSLRRAHTSRPDDPDVACNLGRVLWQQDKYEDALGVLDRLLSQDARCEDALYWKGRCLLDLERFREALPVFERLEQVNPKADELYFWYGRCHSELGAHAQAAAAYEEAFRRDPEDYDPPDILHSVGVCHMKHGDFEAAEVSLQQAHTLNPEHPDILCDLGKVLYQLDRHEDALGVLDRLLSQDAACEDALYWKGRCLLDMERCQEALRVFERLEQVNSESEELHFWYGECHSALGALEHAATAYEEALRRDPKDCDARHKLGLVYYGQGRSTEALKQFEEMLKNDEYAAQAYDGIASCLFDLDLLDAALENWEKALALSPDEPDTVLGMGVILCALERYSEGREHLGKALESRETLGEARVGYLLFWLGLAHLELGDVAQAIEALEESRRATPEECSVNAVLADAYVQAGNHDRARRVLDVALREENGDIDDAKHIERARRGLGLIGG